MKTLLLSIFDGLFATTNPKEATTRSTNRIFITSTNARSGRTLMIEEETHAVWVYLLRSDQEGIDFEGFLCSVSDPLAADINPKDINKSRREAPLPPAFANKYSYVKRLRKRDIAVHWHKEYVTILIKRKVYLVMDLQTKTSYSKGLAKDGSYGKKLESTTLR